MNKRIPMVPRFWRVPILILLFFLGALFWANNKDPLKRIWIALNPKQSPPCEAVVFRPKPLRALPIVFYVHGEDEEMATNGRNLRELAGLGLTVAALEYTKSGEQNFENQFLSLLDYVQRQDWVNTNATIWIGSSSGATRLTKFALNHPGLQPKVIVQLGANWGPEQIQVTNTVATNCFTCSFLFIHGANDVVSSPDHVLKLRDYVRGLGANAELRVLPEHPHDFHPNRTVLFRVIGECLLGKFCGPKIFEHYRSPALWEAKSLPLLAACTPALIWMVLCVYAMRLESLSAQNSPCRRSTLFTIAIFILVLLTCVQGSIHLILPEFNITHSRIALADMFLVRRRFRDEFNHLRQLDCWNGQKLKTLLTHCELANYNCELINWELDAQLYRDFVLSPVITGNDSELDWRRTLWEYNYPRMRKEHSPTYTAEMVVRSLRERITITPQQTSRGVNTIWLRQLADDQGFQIITVAALRSVGIPSRLDKSGKAEFWSEGSWLPTPSPLSCLPPVGKIRDSSF